MLSVGTIQMLLHFINSGFICIGTMFANYMIKEQTVGL